MAHYNSSNSWQNSRSANISSNDLVATAASASNLVQYNSSSLQQSSTNISNNSSINQQQNGHAAYNNAASLLAQFAVNNLTANIPNLPALVQLQSGPVNNATPTQSSLLGQSSTNQSNNYSNQSTRPNISSSQIKTTSSQSSVYEPRPLMEIDTIKRSSNVSSAPKPVPPPSGSPSNQQLNKNQPSSSSRYDSKGSSNNRSSSITNNNRYNNNSNSDSSSLVNSANTNVAAVALMNQNPLAQVILNQLASAQSAVVNNQLNDTLVAALSLAAQSNLVSSNQQTISTNNNNCKRSVSNRRSRSRSINSSSSRNNSNRFNNNNNKDSFTKNSEIKSNPANIIINKKRSRTKSPLYNSTKSNNKNKPNSYNSFSSAIKSSSTSISSNCQKYCIRLPKYSINSEATNVTNLKQRYNNLYIPSDFSNSKNSWTTSLPINKPLKFNKRCLFHIMRKDASAIVENRAIYDPQDADHTWTVKVMLLAMPNMEEFFKRSTPLAEDGWREDKYEHPSKVIQFLVGSKGKHELMALGGPWSPSLDGPNPATNNQTLINTAIRTVKALTGIDLSPCTQWFRFLDIQYNRNEEIKTILNPRLSNSNINNGKEEKNVSMPATSNMNGIGENNENVVKSGQLDYNQETLQFNDDMDIENTIIFLPNVWSLMPNSLEYQNIIESYKKKIDDPINLLKSSAFSSQKQDDKLNLDQNHNENENQAKKNIANNIQSSQINIQETYATPKNRALIELNETEIRLEHATPEVQTDSSSSKLQFTSKIQTINTSLETNESNNITINSLISQSSDEIKCDPTHHSKIDLKRIKVDELRTELMARNLDTKGLKAQLLSRLKDALELEKEKDENSDLNESKEIEEALEISISNSSQQDHLLEEFPTQERSEQLITEKSPMKEMEVVKSSIEQNEQILVLQTEEEMTKSKYEREKMYRIPSSPHIIVHPSATAKNYKFDCQLISLSHLLNYCKDDNKESTFEVSLFAEYFNEMLIRDNGFLIYKHILSIKNQAKNSDSIKRKLISNEEISDLNAENKKLKTDLKSTDNKEFKDINISKISCEETKSNEDVKEIREIKENKENKDIKNFIENNNALDNIVKPKTYYPELLLAFTFLDISKTNYVCSKDIEDLFLLIGLNLTRSKVKAILNKLNFNKDNLINYRSLTDKPVSHLYNLPNDDDIANYIISYDSYMKRIIKKNLTSSEEEKALNSIIEINGTTIDVVQTLKKLENSEINAINIDKKLKESLDDLDKVKTQNRNLERQKQKLSDELLDYKKRLREQERLNKDTHDKYGKYKDCIYRSKYQLLKCLDEINDTIKRGEKNLSSSNSTTATSSFNCSNHVTDISSNLNLINIPTNTTGIESKDKNDSSNSVKVSDIGIENHNEETKKNENEKTIENEIIITERSA